MWFVWLCVCAAGEAHCRRGSICLMWSLFMVCAWCDSELVLADSNLLVVTVLC